MRRRKVRNPQQPAPTQGGIEQQRELHLVLDLAELKNLQSIVLDLEELKQLQSIAKRPHVLSLLSCVIRNLEENIFSHSTVSDDNTPEQDAGEVKEGHQNFIRNVKPRVDGSSRSIEPVSAPDNLSVSKQESTEIPDLVAEGLLTDSIRFQAEGKIDSGEARYSNLDSNEPPKGRTTKPTKRVCYKCGDAGHFVRDCLLPNTVDATGRQMASGDRACFKCGDADHFMKDCLIPDTRDVPGKQMASGDRACFKFGDADHFMSDCPHPNTENAPGRQMALGDRACFKCGDADHFMRDCPHPDSGDVPGKQLASGDRACFKCGDPGHFMRDCPLPNTEKAPGRQMVLGDHACFKCGGAEHFMRDCLHADTGDATGRQMAPGDRACFKCGDAGHFMRDCSRADTGDATGGQLALGDRACFNCGDADHFMRDCPQPDTRDAPGKQMASGDRACFKFGDAGHLVRGCPLPNTQNAPGREMALGDRACFKCGDPGHFIKECPRPDTQNAPDNLYVSEQKSTEQESSEIPNLVAAGLVTDGIRFQAEGKIDRGDARDSNVESNEQPKIVSNSTVSDEKAPEQDGAEAKEGQQNFVRNVKPRVVGPLRLIKRRLLIKPPVGRDSGSSCRSANRSCFKCGDTGHYVRDCPR